MAMTIKAEMISPDQARAMLDGNRGNRRVRRAAVAQIAAEMRAGRWMLTHQGIAIAPDGRLLDGQHRLLGIVEAGVPVMMMVARDADPATFPMLDGAASTAGPRKLFDVTQIDRRILDACTFIVRLHGIGKPTAHQINSMMPTVGDAVLQLLAAAGSAARGRTAAPIKAAAALRYLTGNKAFVLTQWRALVDLQFQEMTPAMQALVRQITDARNGNGAGSAAQYDRAARAWIAFDIRRAANTRIVVNDISGTIAEMRNAWTPTWHAR